MQRGHHDQTLYTRPQIPDTVATASRNGKGEEPGTFDCGPENIAAVTDPDLNGSKVQW